ncbi:hypothetical protein ACFQ3L_03310 [Lacticaseibacillus jixianensis]|uniref:Uncharacterized protein n=1 Tax=Lacticaseibacillus jixianensis TaxID=2486012 RepID=A0ABW4BAY3_9LACO|nr:hypothetical protein [Lacticaseibacillus jixianensis]
MPDLKRPLPVFDAQGRPLRLKPKITYKLRVKNGYILALTSNQHQTRLPNLVHLSDRQSHAQ